MTDCHLLDQKQIKTTCFLKESKNRIESLLQHQECRVVWYEQDKAAVLYYKKNGFVLLTIYLFNNYKNQDNFFETDNNFFKTVYISGDQMMFNEFKDNCTSYFAICNETYYYSNNNQDNIPVMAIEEIMLVLSRPFSSIDSQNRNSVYVECKKSISESNIFTRALNDLIVQLNNTSCDSTSCDSKFISEISRIDTWHYIILHFFEANDCQYQWTVSGILEQLFGYFYNNLFGCFKINKQTIINMIFYLNNIFPPELTGIICDYHGSQQIIQMIERLKRFHNNLRINFSNNVHSKLLIDFICENIDKITE